MQDPTDQQRQQQERQIVDSDDLVLVDEYDNPIGSCAKLAAHENGGRLHRAFSVFIFNRRGQMLLQRRADTKYHFGGLWTNACCSHPRRDQPVEAEAHRRLREELGIDASLEWAFSFVYRARDPVTGLVEHEFDHVFIGHFDGTPRPDPAEVGAWQWVDPAELSRDVQANATRYTPWFTIALDRLLRHTRQR